MKIPETSSSTDLFSDFGQKKGNKNLLARPQNFFYDLRINETKAGENSGHF